MASSPRVASLTKYFPAHLWPRWSPRTQSQRRGLTCWPCRGWWQTETLQTDMSDRPAQYNNRKWRQINSLNFSLYSALRSLNSVPSSKVIINKMHMRYHQHCNCKKTFLLETILDISIFLFQSCKSQKNECCILTTYYIHWAILRELILSAFLTNSH